MKQIKLYGDYKKFYAFLLHWSWLTGIINDESLVRCGEVVLNFDLM